jgi:3-methyladenine DNA glycosylase AlkD
MIDNNKIHSCLKQNPAYDLPFFMIDFVEDIRLRFQNVENQSQAVKMAAYMKNIAPFFGVSSEPRRAIYNDWKNSLPTDLSSEHRWSIVFELWEQEERELHYVAVDWINSWNVKSLKIEDSSQLRFILQSKSWWDIVDPLASNFLGKLLIKFPEVKNELIDNWSEINDFWLHRSTIIFQLKYKQKTDLDLLSQQIERFKSNKEFFIQKAIGWALRDISKWNPEWVKNQVEYQELTGIAKREASKYLSY